MKLKIDKKIFEKFNDLTLGVVVCKNLNNIGNDEKIQEMIRGEEGRIRGKYKADILSKDPKIDIWRKAYAAFGAKPKDNKSSVENLYRLILRGTDLRHINKLVDIYNFISLKYMFPVGGEDTDKIQGDVNLTFAGPDESAVLLLGDKEPHAPHLGEVIYKDDISAICRRWNWREADRTKFTEETKNCFLVIEDISPMKSGEVETAAAELGELVQKFCGGNMVFKILGGNNAETEI